MAAKISFMFLKIDRSIIDRYLEKYKLGLEHMSMLYNLNYAYKTGKNNPGWKPIAIQDGGQDGG